jgi:hypothetical protein
VEMRMTSEEIFEQWNRDCKIDRLNLGAASLDIPILHNKYLQIHNAEKKVLNDLLKKYKKLLHLKTEYYMGLLNGTEELTKLGWPPFKYTILKSDIPRHIEADTDVQKLLLMIDDQKLKVDDLTSILKELNTRNFIIKNAIEWRKFTEGAL